MPRVALSLSALKQHANILKRLISSRLFFFFFLQPLAFRSGGLPGLNTLHPYAASQKVWTEACEKPISPWLNPLMMRTSGLSTGQENSRGDLLKGRKTAPSAGEIE